jgi:transposase
MYQYQWSTEKSRPTSSSLPSAYMNRISFRLHEILDCVSFSRRTFFHIQKLYQHTGDAVKPRSEFTGRPRKLNLEDVQYLVELVRHRPDWFLDELTELMLRNRLVALVATHYTTIYQVLATPTTNSVLEL